MVCPSPGFECTKPRNDLQRAIGICPRGRPLSCRRAKATDTWRSGNELRTFSISADREVILRIEKIDYVRMNDLFIVSFSLYSLPSRRPRDISLPLPGRPRWPCGQSLAWGSRWRTRRWLSTWGPWSRLPWVPSKRDRSVRGTSRRDFEPRSCRTEIHWKLNGWWILEIA